MKTETQHVGFLLRFALTLRLDLQRGTASVLGHHPPLLIAHEIVEECRDIGISISQLSVQKLMYFANGLYLRDRGVPLLSEEMEAWKYGPVSVPVRVALRDHKRRQIEPEDGAFDVRDRNRLDQDRVARRAIRTAVVKYAAMSASQLVTETHRPGTPWANLYRGRQERPARISNEEIREYFSAHSGEQCLSELFARSEDRCSSHGVDNRRHDFRAFISHAESDMFFANRLMRDFEKQGIKCWQYKQDLKPGQVWQDEVIDAIRDCGKFLLICSRRSVYRPNVVSEVIRAIELERELGIRKIVPIMLDDHILKEMPAESERRVRLGQWSEDWVGYVLRRQVGDFVGCETDSRKYAAELPKLIEILQS